MSRFREIVKLSLYDILFYFQSHGIPKIVSSSRNGFKFMWFLFYFASLISCIRIIVLDINDYFQYKVFNTYDIINEKEMRFPAITFCLLNRNNKTYELKDIIISCQFKISYNCSSDIVEYNNTFLRNCFQFNANKNKTLYSKKQGKINGLKMKIFIGLYNETKEDDFVYSDRDGLELIIHNESVIPSRFESIEIQPGVSTNILMNRDFQYDLSKPYSDCIYDLNSYSFYEPTFDDSYYKEIINLDKDYTQNDCFDLVFLRKYNCSLMECSLFNFSHYDSYIDKETNTRQCPSSCNQSLFDLKTSYSDYPSYNEYLRLKNITSLVSKFGNEMSLEDVKKSIVSLNIYYGNLNYWIKNQTPKLEFFDLVANIGGYLSLFLGMSLLSFIDFLHALLEVIILYFESKNK